MFPDQPLGFQMEAPTTIHGLALWSTDVPLPCCPPADANILRDLINGLGEGIQTTVLLIEARTNFCVQQTLRSYWTSAK